MKHRNGCTCPACDTAQYPCGKNECDHVSTGKLKAGQHAASHRRRKRHAVLRPDGLGFLRRVCTDKRLADVMNLGAMTRFQVVLAGGPDAPAPRRRAWRCTKLDRLTMEHYAGLPASALVHVCSVPMQAQSALTVYRLAVLAGVSPRSVLAALCVYGLEYLAVELREQHRAPQVAQPAFKAPPEHAKPLVTSTAPFFPQGK